MIIIAGRPVIRPAFVCPAGAFQAQRQCEQVTAW
jgi:hypothetical protein